MLLLAIFAVACRDPDPSVVVKKVHRPKPVAEVVPAPVHVPREFGEPLRSASWGAWAMHRSSVARDFAHELGAACLNFGDGLDETLLKRGADFELGAQAASWPCTVQSSPGALAEALRCLSMHFTRTDTCRWSIHSPSRPKEWWTFDLTMAGADQEGKAHAFQGRGGLVPEEEGGWRIARIRLDEWKPVPAGEVEAGPPDISPDISVDASQTVNFLDQLTRRERLDRAFLLVHLTATEEPKEFDLRHANRAVPEFQLGVLAWRMPDRLQVVGLLTSGDDDARKSEYVQKWHVTHPLLAYDPKLLAALDRAIAGEKPAPFSILLERRTGRVLWAQSEPPTRSDLARLLP